MVCFAFGAPVVVVFVLDVVVVVWPPLTGAECGGVQDVSPTPVFVYRVSTYMPLGVVVVCIVVRGDDVAVRVAGMVVVVGVGTVVVVRGGRIVAVRGETDEEMMEKCIEFLTLCPQSNVGRAEVVPQIDIV